MGNKQSTDPRESVAYGMTSKDGMVMASVAFRKVSSHMDKPWVRIATSLLGLVLIVVGWVNIGKEGLAIPWKFALLVGMGFGFAVSLQIPYMVIMGTYNFFTSRANRKRAEEKRKRREG